MTEKERKKKIIQDALTPGTVPEKVPLYLNLQGWIVYHPAGYGYTEAVYDSDKIIDSYGKAIRTYAADLYYDMGGYASMFFSRCLGSEDYFLSDEKYSMNFKDISYLRSPDEYIGLKEDPQGFLWNSFYRRKFKNLAPDKIKGTLREYLKLSQHHFKGVEKLKEQLADEEGVLFLSDVPMYQPAFDYLFQYIVGMKGISLDMRRNKTALSDALDSFENLFNHYSETITPPLAPDESPFQAQVCLLGQTITNKKQFETFIWKHLKQKIDEFIEKDLKFYFMVEGGAGPLLDYLDYIPNGLCALHIEKDSLDDLVKRYGDKFTYVGGLPVSVLGNATMEECKKYTLDVLEKYGHNGNFIFSTDKGISFECDVKPDNLKMVCELVNTFKV